MADCTCHRSIPCPHCGQPTDMTFCPPGGISPCDHCGQWLTDGGKPFAMPSEAEWAEYWARPYESPKARQQRLREVARSQVESYEDWRARHAHEMTKPVPKAELSGRQQVSISGARKPPHGGIKLIT